MQSTIIWIMEDIHCWHTKYEACYYSDRLLGKLSELNSSTSTQVDITAVKKAIYYAKKYHGSQLRQIGEPYYSHPLEVAYMVADYLFRTDIIVTAILHDTIEDTELTQDKIAVLFGELIAGQVEDLTRDKAYGKISAGEMIELLFKQKKYEVALIKIFDRIHNLQTVGVKSPEKIKKIITETLKDFLVLAAFLGITAVEKRITQLCEQYSKQFIKHNPLEENNYGVPFGPDHNLLSLVFQNS